ncbi:MAG: molybdopterin-guanine dinucleotide biosynthesis protein B [Peptoniphilaceae bacterium]|uniref:molybdopterin-guanine dinucleotide biosynthesis protein B n=1 Tax=Parvimonas sp. TaxID=1944660 RepID=UPI0025E605A2|nr:molybdopterin-guanine dinucleotide biosynthesis protein B [Parvimonas sp.]MCI5996926.1 molybdopterin-guanine dinucleotide biosynthesis protein B [Parvimonas sp.]MDD7765011.1 molybdopterin-guanine dinucleotide biosynthesis protein B [Peptoniphilaceae bacterium]MDY3050305.1 molybdopterin-guanine dinucleotide biosynthesis protein B [Parvimonas sp.]
MDIKAISIVGECSNVGKTTLIKNLLEIFSKQGLNVGVVKHHHKEFDFDREGKDSYIFSKSGAGVIKMVSPNRVITIENINYEKKLLKVLSEMKDCDFILVEGYKWESLDRIEVYREGYSTKIISDKSKLIAIVSDLKHDIDVVQYDKEDYENIANEIKKYFGIS